MPATDPGLSPSDLDDRCLLRHVQGFFDAAVLGDLIDHFDAIETTRQAEATTPREQGRVRIGATTDALRFDPRWYDPWRHLPAASRALLGPWSWLFFPVQVRALKDDPVHLVPWHQDIAYVNLMPRPHRRILTVFLPLERDPARHATVEFAPGHHPPLPHHAEGGHGAVLDEAPFPATRHFDLALGDILLFGDHVPHRTVVPEGRAPFRRSFEFRLVVPEEALDDKDYFDIDALAWARADGTRSIDQPSPGPSPAAEAKGSKR